MADYIAQGYPYDSIDDFLSQIKVPLIYTKGKKCPGGKIRSKGKGRGLGIGKGKGPIGRRGK